jgi:hypothetical protein
LHNFESEGFAAPHIRLAIAEGGERTLLIFNFQITRKFIILSGDSFSFDIFDEDSQIRSFFLENHAATLVSRRSFLFSTKAPSLEDNFQEEDFSSNLQKFYVQSP